MADMATLPEVEVAWKEILEQTGLGDPITRKDPVELAQKDDAYLVPVTYMNSSADLKDFVGRHGGIVCTSTNAAGALQWAFDRAGSNGSVLFFPDQHLGRNTGAAMGIDETLMPTWTPGIGAMGEVSGSRIILWHVSAQSISASQSLKSMSSVPVNLRASSWFILNARKRPLTQAMLTGPLSSSETSSNNCPLVHESPSERRLTWWLGLLKNTPTSTSNV